MAGQQCYLFIFTSTFHITLFFPSLLSCIHMYIYMYLKNNGGIWEALFPNTQKTSHWMLYLYIPPLKQFHAWPPGPLYCTITFPHSLVQYHATFFERLTGRGGSIVATLELWFHTIRFYLLGLCKELCLYGKNSRPESFESKNMRSRWAGDKRYATACMARSAILIGHMQGHERCTCGKLLIMFKTIWGKLWNKILICWMCFSFF
jgi:hypothetical protein